MPNSVEENKGNKTGSSRKFMLLFLVGFALILVGMVVLVMAALFYSEDTIDFGGVIFVGPFPIVIGVGPNSTLIVLFSIILAVLSIIIFVILRREILKENA